MAFGMLIVGALLAFEMFNFSTTEYSLHDLLGDLSFAGLRWATILAIAFCGMDFAGLARLFTPEQGAEEPAEVWYLFGAWLLAATMNAALTWWGVSVAILSHAPSANAIVGRESVIRIVPIFVALMVWLIRILIIGTFSVAGERIFSQASRRPARQPASSQYPAGSRKVNVPVNPALRPVPSRAAMSQSRANPPAQSMPQPVFRPSPKPEPSLQSPMLRSEPTYHPIAMSASSRKNDDYSSVP
jgi:hypothetical protein